MKIINTRLSLEDFFRKLRETEKRALLLDYDGTLAPFTVERDKAVPYPGVRRILEKISGAGHTRLVIISGRWTKDLIPLLGMASTPEIWGCHGSERIMPDGKYLPASLDESGIRTLESVDNWILKEGLEKYCEKKPSSRAVHLRGVENPEALAIKEKVMDKWSEISGQGKFELHEFDGGVELRAVGIDKGKAVDRIISETGEGTAAAYLGDDLTDEDAFVAVKKNGIAVLVRDEFRETGADVWLRPPEELLEFLTKWHKTCGGI